MLAGGFDNRVFLYCLSLFRKKEIDAALSMTLSIPSVSLNFFRHPLVRHLFAVLDPRYELPTSYNDLTGLMRGPHDRTVAAMKELIAGLKHRPSVTADIWSIKTYKHSFIGATLRFVTNDGLRCGSMFLGLAELHTSHTKAYVRDCLTSLLESYGLDFDNDIFKIVTDNGSNFVAAFREKDQGERKH